MEGWIKGVSIFDVCIHTVSWQLIMQLVLRQMRPQLELLRLKLLRLKLLRIELPRQELHRLELPQQDATPQHSEHLHVATIEEAVNRRSTSSTLQSSHHVPRLWLARQLVHFPSAP